MATFLTEETTFKEGWVNQQTDIIAKKNNIPESEIESLREQIAKIYDEKLVNKKVNIVNNYKNFSCQTTFTDVADILLSHKCVLGGDGVLYKQHEAQLAGLVPIITKYQHDRDAEKDLAKTFEKGTPDNMYHDRNQKNKKVVINALYGLFGYAKFRFFNVNLAQSVTAMGQNIISTATCCFEDYLSDNSKFLTFEEIVMYIDRISQEALKYEEEYASEFSVLPYITDEMLVERISRRVYHPLNEEQAMFVVDYIKTLSDNQKKLLYYKNNFMEFNDTELMSSLLVSIFDDIEYLRLGEMYAFDKMEKTGTKASPDVKAKLEYMLRLYDVFTLSTHQIYDRVRRTKYTRKKSVLYIDTDSNFIGFARFINYFIRTIPDKYQNKPNFIFKAASIMTIILSFVIKKTYIDFTDSLNISQEYGCRLIMKNEFLFSILMFGLVKKRYIGKMILQEGKLIKGGAGDIEVKGFDFKKAATKKPIHDRLCDIINETILDVEQISIADVLRACDEFKMQMRNDIMNGSNTYYKQLSVAKPDKYKNPYSNQGKKGVLLWNVLSDEPIELPAEVDMIKIKLCRDGYLSNASNDPNKVSKVTLERWRLFVNDPEEFFKNNDNLVRCEGLYNLYTNYPDKFYRLVKDLNEKPDLWKTMPTAIAKPRALDEIPEWLKPLIDINSIEMSVINLINPIVESLGVTTIETKSGPTYTTLVEL